MSKDFEKQLADAPKPRRDLRNDFTHDTLAQALAPQSKWWQLRRVHAAPALVAAFVVLLTATSAYAAFNWQQVQVFFTGTTQNKTFNAQEFGFRVDTCDSMGNKTLRYGVANSANVSAEQIASIIKARCDVAQAQQLYEAQSDWKHQAPGQQESVDDTYFVGSIMTIDKIDGNKLATTLAVQDAQGKPLAEKSEDTIAKDARVYVNGQQAALAALKPGDRVVKVLHATQQHNDGRADTINVEVRGLIKVDAQPVDTSLFKTVFEIMQCEGNADATCVDAPSPALRGKQFHANEGEGGNFKVRKDITYSVDGAKGGDLYQAQGRVISMDAQGFTVKAFESDAQFRVNIAEADRKAPYDQDTKLQIGDAVAIRYLQKANENHKEIQMTDIQASFIIVTSDDKKL